MSYTTGLVNQRSYPKLEVLRNFNPTMPVGYTHAARVRPGLTILSGQAMILIPTGTYAGMWDLAFAGAGTSTTTIGGIIYNGSSWTATNSPGYNVYGVGGATTAGLVANMVYFALDDSNNYDAIASQLADDSPVTGEVVGYAAAGQFLLETPWYDNATVNNNATFLPGVTSLAVSSVIPGNLMAFNPTSSGTVTTTGYSSGTSPVVGRVDRGERNIFGGVSGLTGTSVPLPWTNPDNSGLSQAQKMNIGSIYPPTNSNVVNGLAGGGSGTLFPVTPNTSYYFAGNVLAFTTGFVPQLHSA